MESTTEVRPKGYERVNLSWPEGTNDGRDIIPTPQEAMSAAKRLYRFAFKKPFRGKMQLTSGRRYTWIRRGVFYVNPNYMRWDKRNGGWHELVHDFSHYACNRLYPTGKGHGPQHAFLEREMVDHVVKSGWLDGKLKSKAKAPAAVEPEDKDAAMLAGIEASRKRWISKQKRAATALRKLKTREAYYRRKRNV